LHFRHIFKLGHHPELQHWSRKTVQSRGAISQACAKVHQKKCLLNEGLLYIDNDRAGMQH
jgi:hypothetical protein